jgi:hypothetical protein
MDGFTAILALVAVCGSFIYGFLVGRDGGKRR